MNNTKNTRLRSKPVTKLSVLFLVVLLLMQQMPVSANYTGTDQWEGITWNYDLYSTSDVSETDAYGRSDTLKFSKYANYHDQYSVNFDIDGAWDYSFSIDIYGNDIKSWSWAPVLKVYWPISQTYAYIKNEASSYAKWGMTGYYSGEIYGKMYQDRWYTMKIDVNSESEYSVIKLSIRDVTNNGNWVTLKELTIDDTTLNENPIIYIGTDRITDYSSSGSMEYYYYDNFVFARDTPFENFESTDLPGMWTETDNSNFDFELQDGELRGLYSGGGSGWQSAWIEKYARTDSDIFELDMSYDFKTKMGTLYFIGLTSTGSTAWLMGIQDAWTGSNPRPIVIGYGTGGGSYYGNYMSQASGMAHARVIKISDAHSEFQFTTNGETITKTFYHDNWANGKIKIYMAAHASHYLSSEYWAVDNYAEFPDQMGSLSNVLNINRDAVTQELMNSIPNGWDFESINQVDNFAINAPNTMEYTSTEHVSGSGAAEVTGASAKVIISKKIIDGSMLSYLADNPVSLSYRWKPESMDQRMYAELQYTSESGEYVIASSVVEPKITDGDSSCGTSCYYVVNLAVQLPITVNEISVKAIIFDVKSNDVNGIIDAFQLLVGTTQYWYDAVLGWHQTSIVLKGVDEESGNIDIFEIGVINAGEAWVSNGLTNLGNPEYAPWGYEGGGIAELYSNFAMERDGSDKKHLNEYITILDSGLAIIDSILGEDAEYFTSSDTMDEEILQFVTGLLTTLIRVTTIAAIVASTGIPGIILAGTYYVLKYFIKEYVDYLEETSYSKKTEFVANHYWRAYNALYVNNDQQYPYGCADDNYLKAVCEGDPYTSLPHMGPRYTTIYDGSLSTQIEWTVDKDDEQNGIFTLTLDESMTFGYVNHLVDEYHYAGNYWYYVSDYYTHNFNIIINYDTY